MAMVNKDDEGNKTWAVGWSDVHYKTYVTTHGSTDDGEPASKKRQRADGRDYYIDVKRPKIIQVYQQNMGWVDRHNRYRQAMLKLDQVWKTTRYQTRMQLEIMALSMVDTFLACRMFMPKWRDMPGDESVFEKFLLAIIPQLDRRAEDELLRASSADNELQEVCKQVPLGRRTVDAGANAGRTTNIQQRCSYCMAEGRKETDRHGNPTKNSVRTSYTCSRHPHIFCCHESKKLTHPERNCWERHLSSQEV